MATEINITIKDEASALAKRLADDAGLGKAIAGRLKIENDATVSHIQRRYLTFPKAGPSTPQGLRHQTGRYQKSLRASAPMVNGASVTSSIGSNAVSKNGVSYPVVHEFGYVGTVAVPAHSRKVRVGTGVVFTNGRKRRQVIMGETEVRAHSRKLDLPARASIQRGLADRADDYGNGISYAITNYAIGQ